MAESTAEKELIAEMSSPNNVENTSKKRLAEDDNVTEESAKRSRPAALVEETPNVQQKRWHDPTVIVLSEDQKARLEKAKAYAREMKPKLSKKNLSLGLEGSSPDNPIPSALLATNPHIASGVDVRTLSVLSRIYVGSINFELNEMHLKAVFGQFGTIKSVSMSIDPVTMRHKGFCFIEFETPEAASLALETMNGADLGGRYGGHNVYRAGFSPG
ncbi:Poly(U)-binding-splicing factor puf60 [Apophysomyces ossiformis]|uniref:Poly(U)-binding-splicing factor puf60 n=1 Tax=Apophysomyces ossiformis TaxID=679940 RepID=A0A8H7EUB1_9FUNG|nr:Poly(U)-binding-splicing factor puf60 [Apophysomyces ossiformis]